MSALSFDEARAIVIEKTAALHCERIGERVPLAEAAGRTLAEAVRADRDYPPFPRSARDGFAVRAADVAQTPARLRVLGETRAGEPSRFTVGEGEAVEIMTGAPAPQSFQIRNSNAISLAAQVRRRGGEPLVLPIAPDRLPETRDLIRKGLEADMLLLSGGVSMGKHDLVETALEELGAEIFVTQVKIQPGKPFVFGVAGGRPIFGLPGNPVSTMVTFEIFARAALEMLAGNPAPGLPFLEARLASPFRHKPVLTRFLPARLTSQYFETAVEPIQWQGSGDLNATARANCFLVAADTRESWDAGDRIAVLPL